MMGRGQMARRRRAVPPLVVGEFNHFKRLSSTFVLPLRRDEQLERVLRLAGEAQHCLFQYP